MSNPLPPLIIDTDAGHDDALALMMMFKANQFDIKAVTTVAGNSSIDKVTRNARAVMNLLKVSTDILYSGSSKPLKRDLVTAVVHGESGLDGFDVTQTKPGLTGNAVEKMKSLIESYPHQIRILTLGPLTNVAKLFNQFPHTVPLVKAVVIMGGAIDVPGNKNRVAEFNIFVDPEAADIVFRSHVEKVVVPLDPCNSTVLSLDTFEALSNTSLYEPIKSMMKHFITGIEKDEGVKGALVYDAIAAYYLLNPDAFKLDPMDVVIETKGEHTFGMTVAEKRLKSKKNHNVKVAKKIDSDTFVNNLISILRKE